MLFSRLLASASAAAAVCGRPQFSERSMSLVNASTDGLQNIVRRIYLIILLELFLK
jgi:hypothetical protein